MSDWQDRFSIAGQTALVTGASKGIGAEICAVFADAGADVIAVGRDEAGLAETAEAVRRHARTCTTIAEDLTTSEGPVRAGERALETGAAIDILVNSAGIARVAPALDLTVEDWDATMAVNLRAPFLLSQVIARGMIARRRGKIIMISSQTGVIAVDDHAAYASSKGGLNALTQSLCAEWAQHNVQVNAICPTVILTPMGQQVWGPEEKAAPMLAKIPLRRFGEPVEVADAALYLASPASDLVNGALLMPDGGYTAL